MMLFSEHNFHRKRPIAGSIEVICGSMFSGKTEELIRRLRRAELAQLQVEIFKPEIDVRYAQNHVVSHDANRIASKAVSSSQDILKLDPNTRVVGIDEAQFFDQGIVEVCNKLAALGLRVIVAGLDMDYLGQPFGPVPDLMAIAEEVTKVHAVCVRCGAPANFSYRLKAQDQQILLGEKESYEPRCRSCYFGPQKDL